MPAAAVVSPSSDTECQSSCAVVDWLRLSDAIVIVNEQLYRDELEPKSLFSDVKHNLAIPYGVVRVCYFDLFVVLLLGPNRFIYLAPLIKP